jgi:hypothetical protein
MMAPTSVADPVEKSFVASEFAERLEREGPDRLRDPLRDWLRSNGARRDASFVYCAWLSAAHEPQVVRPAIGAWIERHGLLDCARFVYAAWLLADGERAVVREPIRRWLAIHGDEPAA